MEAFLAPVDVLGTEPSAGRRAGLASDPEELVWAAGTWSTACDQAPPLWASDFPLATRVRPQGAPSASSKLLSAPASPQPSPHRFHLPGPLLHRPWVYLAIGLISRY